VTGALGGSLASLVAATAQRLLYVPNGSACSGILCQPFIAEGNYSEIAPTPAVGGLVGHDLSLLSKLLQSFRVPSHLHGFRVN